MTQGQFFKRSLTGLNAVFSFSKTGCLTKAEEPSLPYSLPIAGGRIIGFIPFPRVLVLCEMQSVTSRIWTRVAVFISYNDNDYITGTKKLYTHKPDPILENETHEILLDFLMQTDPLMPTRKPDWVIVYEKKNRTCQIVNFAVSADHRVKTKENEKGDKLLDLTRKQKKVWNMKMTVILIVIGELGTIPKDW